MVVFRSSTADACRFLCISFCCSLAHRPNHNQYASMTCSIVSTSFQMHQNLGLVAASASSCKRILDPAMECLTAETRESQCMQASTGIATYYECRSSFGYRKEAHPCKAAGTSGYGMSRSKALIDRPEEPAIGIPLL